MEENGYATYEFVGAADAGEGEAELTVGGHRAGVTGRVAACNGHTVFLVVNVGGAKHVWVELAPEDEQHHFKDVVVEPDEEEERSLADRATDAQLRQQGINDKTTVADISIKMYYTAGYAAQSSNLMGDVSVGETLKTTRYV